MFVGSIATRLLLKNPNGNELAKSTHALPIVPVTEQKPEAKSIPIEAPRVSKPVEKPWQPEPGESCILVMPRQTCWGDDVDSMYIIPRDILALSRFLKYVKARDGGGFGDLLYEGRAVWTDDPRVDVSMISVVSGGLLAEVRVHSTVYIWKYRNAKITKSDSEKTSGVESVVPLDWLFKK